MYRLSLVLICIVLFYSCSKNEGRIQPKIHTITSSVYASVIVMPDSAYQLFTNINGILEKNYVTEGDVVEKGSPLLQVINSAPKLNADNARLSYQLAQKNYSGNTSALRSIEKDIKAAKLKLTNDSINFYRQKNLWDQHIGSKEQFDSKKLTYELSINAVTNLESKYNQTYNQLETKLQQAINSYKNASITTQDFTVSSKMDGKVYALYKNPGELITATQPLGMVGSANTFIIEMLVDEVDIVTIKMGQKVLVSLDAYPEKIFVASVAKIYPNKDERNQTFKVEASFQESPETLYPGLSGEGNIIVAVKKNALIIPKEYILDGTKVRTDSGWVDVKVGLQNMDSVEIVSGINQNTYLLKPNQ